MIVTRLSLIKTDDLNFGKIIAGTTAGTVTVTPAGARTATGGARLAGTGAQPAAFAGYGFQNQTVTISVNSNTPVVRRVGGSAIVSRGSAPAFGNLLLWKDEVVPWLRRLSDDVHELDTAVMIQLTHMGHRSSSMTHDGLPAISASNVREPSHRAFTKAAEHWELDDITQDFVDAAPGMTEFRRVMFTRLVPNLRAIGLLGPRVAARYEKVGLLQYMGGLSADELTEETMMRELDSAA